MITRLRGISWWFILKNLFYKLLTEAKFYPNVIDNFVDKQYTAIKAVNGIDWGDYLKLKQHVIQCKHKMCANKDDISVFMECNAFRQPKDMTRGEMFEEMRVSIETGRNAWGVIQTYLIKEVADIE